MPVIPKQQSLSDSSPAWYPRSLDLSAHAARVADDQPESVSTALAYGGGCIVCLEKPDEEDNDDDERDESNNHEILLATSR